jgi:hypothetical protein
MPIGHRKGIAAVVGMFAVICAPAVGVRLLTASIADPTWLIPIGVAAVMGALWRKQIVALARSLLPPSD